MVHFPLNLSVDNNVWKLSAELITYRYRRLCLWPWTWRDWLERRRSSSAQLLKALWRFSAKSQQQRKGQDSAHSAEFNTFQPSKKLKSPDILSQCHSSVVVCWAPAGTAGRWTWRRASVPSSWPWVGPGPLWCRLHHAELCRWRASTWEQETRAQLQLFSRGKTVYICKYM